MAQRYRMQRGRGKKGGGAFITVPADIAALIPADVTFECDLTEEGILYRAVSDGDRSERLPGWIQRGEGSSE